ncbi:MAG: sensor histidine kinase, partial [Candidatus Heimdallarchaeota archaeon]
EALFPKSLVKLFKKGLKGKRITEDRLRVKDYTSKKADPFSIVSFKVVPMATKEGEITEILVLCEDVTKLAMQEEALGESFAKLEILNDKLLQLNKDRSNFVELTSTKLIEPLRNSKALLENILSGQLGMLSEELFGTMEFLRNNLDKVTKSILGIVEFSNVEAQDFSLSLSEHNLKELISQTTSLVGSVGIEKSFIGTVDVSNDISVWCDSEQIIRVLRNLVLNAIQFTPLNCDILFTAKEKNGLVTVYVKDNGYGIHKKDLSIIFDQYVKIDPHSSGSGLGLSVVKSLVEAHGGTVRAESEGKNKGSTFIFTLPTNKGSYTKLMSKKEKSK